MKVSFIIPVYNAARYLPRLLKSLESQKYLDWEAIFIDDASSDNSLDILKHAALGDGRIRIFQIEHAGSSAARNKGLDNATGDIIGFIDADDFVHPQLIETALPHFGDVAVDVVIWDFTAVQDGQLFEFPLMTSAPECKILTDVFQWALKPWKTLAHDIWRAFYRREIIGGIRFYPGIKHQDLLFSYQIWGGVKKAVKLDCVLYAYLQSENSVIRSAYTADKIEANFTIMRELHRFYAGRGYIQKVLKHYLYPRRIKDVWKQVDKAEPNGRSMHELVDKRIYECIRDGVVGFVGFSVSKMLKLVACRFRGRGQRCYV